MEGKTNSKTMRKQDYAEILKDKVEIARFSGTVIIKSDWRWRDMSSDLFASACYTIFGSSITKSMIGELEHLFRNTAEDMSNRSHMLLFFDRVWNMRSVAFDETIGPETPVYGIPYVPREGTERIQFILDLACGDEALYDDIMESIAPLILERKPTGIIWYLGMGANGKSALVHLLHIIFGEYLTQITVKQLEDERDAPQLNGKLGNIPTESSESLIKDTRTYKSIGTHESFLVHKFHSQEMTSVNGNVHHIFSTNNIPTFSDKSDGAKRRTLIIPFNNHFAVDESFEERTFTKEFIELFLGEVIKYARRLRDRNYSYKFSDASRSVKEQYDIDSNTSAAYADEIVSEGLVAFDNYRNLMTDYENWAIDNGYNPSTINVLRRSMKDKGFARKTRRLNDGYSNIYMYKETAYSDVEVIAGKPGMFRLSDDVKEEDKLL